MNQSPAILLLGSDFQQLESVKGSLVSQGMRVHTCTGFPERDGLHLALGRTWSLLLMLHEGDEFDSLRMLSRLSKVGNQVPSLVLFTDNDPYQRAAALDLGADDCVMIPFNQEELGARVRAVLRRHGAGEKRAARTRKIGPLYLDLEGRTSVYKGREVELSPREFALLALLADEPGRTWTRAQILERVWSYDFDPQSNIVEVHVQRIRTKLDFTDREAVVETVRGVGYRIRVPREEESCFAGETLC